MKRSTLTRNTPLVSRTPMKRGTAMLERTSWKRRPRKKRPGHDQKMLNACKGEPCYLLMPRVRCSDRDTVVPAHENQGKGMGLKTADVRTVPGCYACHYAYDHGGHHTRAEKRDAFLAAFCRWEPVRARKLGQVT